MSATCTPLQRGLPDAFGKIEFKPGTEEISTNAVKNLKWIAKLGAQSYGNVTVSGRKSFHRHEQRTKS